MARRLVATTLTPECTALLLCRGEDALRVDDVWCVPGERFLRELHPHREVDHPRKRERVSRPPPPLGRAVAGIA